jgi:DNA-binding transcriptional ArsR family regulator
METLTAQRLMACLGDASRFRVMTELVSGDRCVSDLARIVGLSQSCTTRHLQVLEREGLVHGARAGKKVVYQVSAEPRILALLAWALPESVTSAADLPAPSPRTRRPLRRSEGASTESAVPETHGGGIDRPAPSPDLEDFLL